MRYRSRRRANPMKTAFDLIMEGDLRVRVYEMAKHIPATTRTLWWIKVILVREGRPEWGIPAEVLGTVKAKAITVGEEKNPLFFTSWGGVEEGYGPLLYDIAMEYIYEQAGGGLASDAMVSKHAYKVWNTYLHERTEDVERDPVPDHIRIRAYGDPDDSCWRDDEEQDPRASFVTFKGKTSRLEETKCWDDPDAEAMRYVFWKPEPTVLDELQSAGKIDFFDNFALAYGLPHVAHAWPSTFRTTIRGASETKDWEEDLPEGVVDPTSKKIGW
jgi:hypothetical protein